MFRLSNLWNFYTLKPKSKCLKILQFYQKCNDSFLRKNGDGKPIKTALIYGISDAAKLSWVRVLVFYVLQKFCMRRHLHTAAAFGKVSYFQPYETSKSPNTEKFRGTIWSFTEQRKNYKIMKKDRPRCNNLKGLEFIFQVEPDRRLQDFCTKEFEPWTIKLPS